MTTHPIRSGNRKGYQATQLLGERIITAICPTRLEAIKEVINEINRDWLENNIPY
jgi:hypothetical protein